MNTYDNQYLDLVEDILNNGEVNPCRTGNNTLVKLNRVLTHDLAEGFPILTFRPLPFKGCRVELECFLMGNTDKKYYQDRGCQYWNSWANPKLADPKDKEAQFKERDLGPIYGYQWVAFNAPYERYDVDNKHLGINQIKRVVDTLKVNPYDRRLIVNAWNPSQEDQMALPPCVYVFQFNYVGGRLHITVNQRSCDLILGVPTDFQFYSLLLHLMAQTVGMVPGTVTLNLCNCHIYDNHVELVKDNLMKWRKEQFDLPKLILEPEANVFNFRYEMAKLDNYQHGDKVTFPIAV